MNHCNIELNLASVQCDRPAYGDKNCYRTKVYRTIYRTKDPAWRFTSFYPLHKFVYVLCDVNVVGWWVHANWIATVSPFLAARLYSVNLRDVLKKLISWRYSRFQLTGKVHHFGYATLETYLPPYIQKMTVSTLFTNTWTHWILGNIFPNTWKHRRTGRSKGHDVFLFYYFGKPLITEDDLLAFGQTSPNSFEAKKIGDAVLRAGERSLQASVLLVYLPFRPTRNETVCSPDNVRTSSIFPLYRLLLRLTWLQTSQCIAK